MPTTPEVRNRTETSIGAGTTLTINFGANTAGDLCLIFIGLSDTAQTITTTESFTNLTNASATFHIIYKVLAGTEGTSTAVTVGSSTKGAAIAYTIKTGTHASGTAPVYSTVATGTSTSPNSGSLSPSGGSAKYLWISAFRQNGEEADDDTWCTAAPSTPGTFSNRIQTTSGTAGTAATNGSIASAEYAAETATVDPGAFTVAQSLAWRAYTVAIYPSPNTSVDAGLASGTGTAQTVVQNKNASAGLASGTGAAQWGGGNYASTIAADGASHHWRMGEPSGTTINDDIGALDGTYYNTPTLAATGLLTGDSDTAVTFTAASTEYADCPDTGLATGTGSRTIEAWVKTTSATVQPFFHYGTAAAGQWVSCRVAANGQAVVSLYGDDPAFGSAGQLSDGTRHYVAITYDGSSLRVYIDGAEASGSPQTKTLGTVLGGTAWIGTSGSDYFNGTIDEVSYTPSTLGASTISSHWSIGTGGGVTTGARASVGAMAPATSGTGTAPQPTVQVTSSGTMAPAGLAEGAGVAPQSAGQVRASAGVSPGAGTAPTPIVNRNALAGLSSGTGTAPQSAAQVRATAGLAAGQAEDDLDSVRIATFPAAASGTGTAPTWIVNRSALAGVASGTGTAPTWIANRNAVAGLGAGTGTAPQVLPHVAVMAPASAGTGTAPQPSVTTTGATNASAGLAAGTGAAENSAAHIRLPAGLAAGTGTAPASVGNPGVIAGLTSGTGTAQQARANPGTQAGLASGTGAAYGGVARIAAYLTAAASGTGTAPQPTVQTAGSTNAPAGLASGTGTSYQPSAYATRFAPAGTASGSGTAQSAVAAISAMLSAASGTGAANAATTWAQEGVSASAGLARGTGVAWPVKPGSTGGLAPGTQGIHQRPRGSSIHDRPKVTASGGAPGGTASNDRPRGAASYEKPRV